MKIKFSPKLFFIVLFLLSFTVLFVVEGPFVLAPYISSFSSILPPDLLMEDSWYGAYFQDTFVGYSHFYMTIQEQSKGGGYLLKNEASFKLPVLGSVCPFSANTIIELAGNYSLREAQFRIDSENYFFEGNIKKQIGDSYLLVTRSPANTEKKIIPIKGELISHMMGPVSLNYVPLKQQVNYVFYDPFVDRQTKVKLENKGKITMEVEGKVIDVYEIDMDVEGVKGKMWVNEQGRMVKEEFLGFKFIKEEPQNLVFQDMPGQTKDLVEYFAIKTSDLPDKENLNFLKVRIRGITAECITEDFNQKIIPQPDGSFIVEIQRESLPQVESAILTDTDFSEYLKEDQYIRFNNSDVKRVVQSVVKNEKDTIVILNRLLRWMDTNIKKIPTISFPNTQDVLRIKRGDCNELSALLAGLLRSIGIPAYVNVGVVYLEGRFFYHAWVSVYVKGRWIDTDPALNQLVADPTHIKLMRGFENQFEIARSVGKLDIEILEYR